MKKRLLNIADGLIYLGIIAAIAGILFLLSGCGNVSKDLTSAASGKNLGLDGYMMYGSIETANPETATPEGKLIIGRVTYKSRKVGIPADQKIPNAGNFKATKTKSLFGAEEIIIEYDWTAGSDADNQAAELRLQKMKKSAEKEFTSKTSTTKESAAETQAEKAE